MAIKGIGVDLVDLSRIDLTHERFINRILTPLELEEFNQRGSEKTKKEYLGGRFAAKEAVLKAFGKGIGEMSFQSIEILNKESGEPYLNIPHAHISLSHDGSYVIAFVVIEE